MPVVGDTSVRLGRRAIEATMQLATYPKNADVLYDAVNKAFRGSGLASDQIAVMVDVGTDFKPPSGWIINDIASSDVSGEIILWLKYDG